MKIPAKDWQAYISKLSAINKKAGELLQKYCNRHGMEDIEALLTYAHALVDRYGGAGSELACQMYDALARAQRANVPLAEPARIANRKEVAGALLNTQGTGNMVSSVQRLVKTASSDTMLKNAKRDKAEWAWISKGDTCPFCMTLASQGWMPASKAVLKGDHAEHIHANCDCEFAIRFDGKSTVEGYEPQRFKKIYDEAEGRNVKDKLNSIRRMQYASIKDERNARRRELYAAQSTSILKNRLDFIVDGDCLFIPTGSEINHVKTIAGKGTDIELRQAKYLSKEYGGNVDSWTKKVGQITSEKYIYDIHWYENSDNKQYRVKMKSRKENTKK
ncbi:MULTISPECIES: hypothetical protein [Terrabacteria group]|uniref:VG15 protein n=1 Tax=Bacillati TaxID=1783272 RepID=UPI001C6F47DE|nr:MULTISPECIES: hypothetical protein [Terrabacteria group]MBW9212977.1 hypothetical protein [Trueperella sp. zg.1013]